MALKYVLMKNGYSSSQFTWFCLYNSTCLSTMRINMKNSFSFICLKMILFEGCRRGNSGYICNFWCIKCEFLVTPQILDWIVNFISKGTFRFSFKKLDKWTKKRCWNSNIDTSSLIIKLYFSLLSSNLLSSNPRKWFS